MKYKQTHEYKEKGVRYMRCQAGCCYVRVGDNASAVRCSKEVNYVIAQMFPEENKPIRVKTGRPAGWHWMAEFVDKDGNVFHKGVEQPKLKGTRPITLSKEKKKIPIYAYWQDRKKNDYMKDGVRHLHGKAIFEYLGVEDKWEDFLSHVNDVKIIIRKELKKKFNEHYKSFNKPAV